ncbi:MAG: extracellular solute-binding protein [Candidatus Sumerlaeota bacterium]|nr:extracellular solute-binding protein [Candidatus Sumerlaeota bacterium]
MSENKFSPSCLRWARLVVLAASCAFACLAAVRGAEPADDKLIFWHTQGDDRGQLLAKIIEEYNASNPPMRIEAIFKGSYNDIYRATRANLIAGNPPDLVIAYENMVPEYVNLGKAKMVDLNPLIQDPQIGLKPEEIDDFFPAFLALNRYPQFNNAMLSFAFTKSLLVLYVNDDMIKEAGFSAPPKTWDEFFDQCAAMKKIGKKGYPIAVDASTLDGMFMSRGAKLVADDQRTTNLDSPPVIDTLAFLRRLAEADAVYQIDADNDQDLKEFVQRNAPFFFRSSTRRPTLERDIGDKFHWSMNVIPHGEGVEPMTILYGGNICVFDTGEARVKAAWHFLKYFSSPEVTARWAVGSGYMPLRKSSRSLPVMQEWFRESPVNRQVFDLIPLGRPEPSPEGWQQVRPVIERAAIDALLGRGAPEEIAAGMKREADDILRPLYERKGKSGATYIALGVIALAVVVTVVLRRRRPAADQGETEE